jgi:hypothetical protein
VKPKFVACDQHRQADHDPGHRADAPHPLR